MQAIIIPRWGFRFKSRRGDEGNDSAEDEAAPRQGQKRTRASASSTGERTKAACTEASATAVPALSPTKDPVPSSKSAKKQAKDLDAAEQAVLEAEQIIKKLGDASLLFTIQLKGYTAVLAKVEGRLAPDLISVYTSEYKAGEDERGTRGMEVLQKLRDCKMKLEASLPVMKCLAATTGGEVSAAALSSALEAAKATGVTFSESINEMLVVRAIAEAVKELNFKEVAELTACSERVFSLKIIASADLGEISE